MTAWVLGGKVLKRLFLCSHSITRLFAMKIITPEKINFKNFFKQCNNFASFFPSIRVNLLFRSFFCWFSFSLFLLR